MSESTEQYERLHATTDVTEWAKEWVATAAEILARNNGDYLALLDEGWMIGWFANYAQACNDALRNRPLHLGTWHAFLYFYHLDHSNAAFHTSSVRYSPITFRLAEFINSLTNPMTPHPTPPSGGALRLWDDHRLQAVTMDIGRYEEDPGR